VVVIAVLVLIVGAIAAAISYVVRPKD